MINHIVISAGGVNVFSQYGALKYLNDNSFWNIVNIKSFHATSAGAMISLMLMLKFDLNEITDYIVNRPWDKVYSVQPETIFKTFENKGLFDIQSLITMFEPLFKSKDMSIDITLKELYELTNKDFFIYVSELNSFEPVIFNHKTHPNAKVIEVVYMSSALPPIFSPFLKDDKCYFDGGMFNYYPIHHLLSPELNIDTDTILGLYVNNINYENKNINIIDNSSNLFSYLSDIMNKLINNTIHQYDCKKIKYEVEISNYNLYNIWKKIMYDKETRIELIDLGINAAKKLIHQ